MRKLILGLIFVTHAFALPVHAAFDEGYISAQDLMVSLHEKFGRVKTSTCQVVDDSQRSSLGDPNPITGSVSVTSLNPVFLTWYNSCLSEYLMMLHGSMRTDSRAKEVTDEIYKALLPILSGPLANNIYTLSFTHLGEDMKKAHIENLVRWALGSDEEIASYGYVTNVEEFRKDLLTYATQTPDISVFNATSMVLKLLLTRDEFLLY